MSEEVKHIEEEVKEPSSFRLIFTLGVAGFLFHLLLGHLKAISIIQKSRTQKLFNALINITIKDVHPFSFLIPN